MTTELGLPGLKDTMPERGELVLPKSEGKQGDGGAGAGGEEEEDGEDDGGEGEATELAKDLHKLLMETTIQDGKLVCAACGHEYAVKEGIANFLLPSHMV